MTVSMFLCVEICYFKAGGMFRTKNELLVADVGSIGLGLKMDY